MCPAHLFYFKCLIYFLLSAVDGVNKDCLESALTIVKRGSKLPLEGALKRNTLGTRRLKYAKVTSLQNSFKSAIFGSQYITLACLLLCLKHNYAGIKNIIIY